MYKFGGDDTDTTSDNLSCYDVYCCVYKFGGDDTDTTSDIYLAMMCIVVCTGLVKQYNQVMQRYCVQYLSCYDVYCCVHRFGEEVQPGNAEVLCPVSVLL